jgi:hypothetical protein
MKLNALQITITTPWFWLNKVDYTNNPNNLEKCIYLEPLGSYKGAMVDSLKKLKTLNLKKLQTYKTNTTKVSN